MGDGARSDRLAPLAEASITDEDSGGHTAPGPRRTGRISAQGAQMQLAPPRGGTDCRGNTDPHIQNAPQHGDTVDTPTEDPSRQLQFGQSTHPSLVHSGVLVMSHGHNKHASAVAAGYRQFPYGGDTHPLHYVHVWMLAQRAQGEGYPTEDYIWIARHAGPRGAGHVLTNEQHVAELLRERILRDSESKGTPVNFSAVVNHLTSLACVRHETRNGIAFRMHTQIGEEGQQIAHTLVIIGTGMRTVPDSADHTALSRWGEIRGFVLTSHGSLRRLLCASWTKLDNTIAYQQRVGTQAATGAASTPARASHGGESIYSQFPGFLGATPSSTERSAASSTISDPSDPSKYERLLNNFPKRQDKKTPFATYAVAFVNAVVRARQYLMKVEGYQLSRWGGGAAVAMVTGGSSNYQSPTLATFFKHLTVTSGYPRLEGPLTRSSTIAS
eukprot:5133676-Pleurochrysis_carterae.AAC.7